MTTCSLQRSLFGRWSSSTDLVRQTPIFLQQLRGCHRKHVSGIDCFKTRLISMNDQPVLSVPFFRTDAGRLPVQQWLKRLNKADRKVIGRDIHFVQFDWPWGMPLVRKIEPYLWEVRSRLSNGRIARVLFTVEDNEMVLLHGFIKKSQRISQTDLSLARHRRNLWRSGRGRHE